MVAHIFTTDDDAGHGVGGIRIEPGPHGGLVVYSPGDTYSFEEGTGTYRMLLDLLGNIILNQAEVTIKGGADGRAAFFRFADAEDNTLGYLTAYPGGMLLQSGGDLTIETFGGLSTMDFDPSAGLARLHFMLDMEANRITDLAAGSDPSDAATVAQLPRLEPIAVTVANGRNDNIVIGSTAPFVFAQMVGPTAAFGISGLAAPANSQLVILHNGSSYDMTIYNENANSLAPNRIRCTTTADLLTTGRGNVTLAYDAMAGRWVDLAFRG